MIIDPLLFNLVIKCEHGVETAIKQAIITENEQKVTEQAHNDQLQKSYEFKGSKGIERIF